MAAEINDLENAVTHSSSHDTLQEDQLQTCPISFSRTTPGCLSSPLRLQEYCKRRVLKQLGLHRLDHVNKLAFPQTLKCFLTKISLDYFAKPEHCKCLQYLNHFTLRNIHIAECIINKMIYILKAAPLSDKDCSVNSLAWKAIRHPNVMQFVVSARDDISWQFFHVFQGTKMSLRVCQELKVCRKLIIPEPLLWSIIEQLVAALIYIHFERKLVYNNFGLEHVYLAWDNEHIVLENPLLHDNTTLEETESPEATRASDGDALASSRSLVHDLPDVTSVSESAFILKESERRAIYCIGKIMQRLSLPGNPCNVLFGQDSSDRHRHSTSIQRAVRVAHYSNRLITLIERMVTAGVDPSWPSLFDIQTLIVEARGSILNVLTERKAMTITEYFKPEDGSTPLMHHYMPALMEAEEDTDTVDERQFYPS